MLQNRVIDAVILAGGDYPTAERPLEILHQAKMVICCDGGADRYIAEGHTPDIIIGDGDSLSAENRTRFADRIIYEADQETNDQTKAVKYLLSKGLKRMAIVGATGKRDDHTLGNIALLSEYRKMGAEVRSYTDYGVFIPCCGTCRFSCLPKAQVSVFNIDAKHFQSNGLAYPIYDFTRWWQGTLNEASDGEFMISAEGEYLLFVTYEGKTENGKGEMRKKKGEIRIF